MNNPPTVEYILGLPFYVYDNLARSDFKKYDCFFNLYKIEIRQFVHLDMAGTKLVSICNISYRDPESVIQSFNLGSSTVNASKEDALIKAYRDAKIHKFKPPNSEFLEFLSNLEDNYVIKDILE